MVRGVFEECFWGDRLINGTDIEHNAEATGHTHCKWQLAGSQTQSLPAHQVRRSGPPTGTP